jgi:hypothetical protein
MLPSALLCENQGCKGEQTPMSDMQHSNNQDSLCMLFIATRWDESSDESSAFAVSKKGCLTG